MEGKYGIFFVRYDCPTREGGGVCLSGVKAYLSFCLYDGCKAYQYLYATILRSRESD